MCGNAMDDVKKIASEWLTFLVPQKSPKSAVTTILTFLSLWNLFKSHFPMAFGTAGKTAS